MSLPPRVDQIAGCLLAGACGDAIGSYYEGRPPSSIFVIPNTLRVTDDTQLTIATCESIIESRSVNPESIAVHFVRWFRERRITGIGSSTLKALVELDDGGHWALVGATGEHSAGNGAAMRIAPLAFFLNPDINIDRQTIRDVCRITHRNDEAYIGALAILRSIRYGIEGKRFDETFLALLIDSIPDSRVRDRLIVLRDKSLSIAEYCSRFGSTGYVVDSVPLAILAALKSTDWLSTIRQIVRFGGDTDTIASMYGHILGAAFGSPFLPQQIIDQVDSASQIRKIAARLSCILNDYLPSIGG